MFGVLAFCVWCIGVLPLAFGVCCCLLYDVCWCVVFVVVRLFPTMCCFVLVWFGLVLFGLCVCLFVVGVAVGVVVRCVLCVVCWLFVVGCLLRVACSSLLVARC